LSNRTARVRRLALACTEGDRLSAIGRAAADGVVGTVTRLGILATGQAL